MKLGEGGEAFFVFETSDEIPEDLQTSPLISPLTSPQSFPLQHPASSVILQEPDFLDLSTGAPRRRPSSAVLQHSNGPLALSPAQRAQSDLGMTPAYAHSPPAVNAGSGNLTPLSVSPNVKYERPGSGDWSNLQTVSGNVLERSASEELLPLAARAQIAALEESRKVPPQGRASDTPAGPVPDSSNTAERSNSPPILTMNEAVNRAVALSKKLSGSNIPTHVSDTGDLMLDMTGYKSSEEEALRAENIARKILAEELEGNYDIGALIGADEHGNLWIYSSEEAKEAAIRKARVAGLVPAPLLDDAVSDPGYHSDEELLAARSHSSEHYRRRPSDLAPTGLATPPQTPPDTLTAGDPNRNYAKTLRLTSAQLQGLKLKPGPNTMSFSVNRATCHAYMYYWTYNVPVVISDIDGTITK